MIQTFLRAKHWQLFLLVFGAPFLIQIILMTSVFASIATDANPDVLLLTVMKVYPFVMLLVTGVLFGWMWSVGAGLHEKVPEELRLNLNWFKFTILFPFSYLAILMIAIFAMFSLSEFSEQSLNPMVIFLIIPFHLITIVCMFYCFYHVARTMRTAELKKKLQFGDYAGEFFLIWFYPIGVWVLQPRINKLERGEEVASASDPE